MTGENVVFTGILASTDPISLERVARALARRRVWYDRRQFHAYKLQIFSTALIVKMLHENENMKTSAGSRGPNI
jgi:hypothetical protein